MRDQADKWRMSTSNALGQMVSVTEDPTASFTGYTHTGTNLVTNYSYDTLSNLTHVGQDGQSREFHYSSMGRLITAANPESGTSAYVDDPNGNSATKTDARLTTTYTYDALNRPVTRTYSDGTTPTVNYSYFSGGVSTNNGNLASVANSVSTITYTGYDALGRLTGSRFEQQVSYRW
jgi:YD repeat-containing protein